MKTMMEKNLFQQKIDSKSHSWYNENMEQLLKNEHITLDNEDYFDKIVTKNGIVYKCKNYPGPIAINATIKKNEEKLDEKSKEII